MSRPRVSRTEHHPEAHVTISDDLADRALAALQPHAPRQLTRDEARTMAGRLVRFAEILLQAGPPESPRD
ncbi:hypothetical protein L6R53_03610 [Myxococcota bacterium]|nr:hypothetical protein [Myxococcota bacterium]